MGVRCRQKNSSPGSLSCIKRLAEWCQTMIPRDEYFDLPITHERFFFLHTLYHFWRLITSIVDISHIVITFLWRLMTALTSVSWNLTMVYLLIPIQPVHIKSVRNLDFYLTLANVSFDVCFYKENQFSDSSITWILSVILGRYTWYILGCRMKAHK